MRTTWAVKLALLGSGWLFAIGGNAKESKSTVPAYVLAAHTVAVMIDPEAGISIEDPGANRIAQSDVETAIANWGRFTTVLSPRQADLVIVLRRGHSRLADETISDPRQNSRPGMVHPTDNGVSIGAQHGQQPGLDGSPADATTNQPGGHPQLELGGAEDSFAVYEGGVYHPLDSAPGWRWVRKDGLHPHDVPAVAEFRKAITAAEKQAGKKP